MKTILLPITGGTQLEAIRNALAQRREVVQEAIYVLDAIDAENIAAYEKELLAVHSILGNIDDNENVKPSIVVLVEKGLVTTIMATHHVEVAIADLDIEEDDRNLSPDDISNLIAGMKEVY